MVHSAPAYDDGRSGAAGIRWAAIAVEEGALPALVGGSSLYMEIVVVLSVHQMNRLCSEDEPIWGVPAWVGKEETGWCS